MTNLSAPDLERSTLHWFSVPPHTCSPEYCQPFKHVSRVYDRPRLQLTVYNPILDKLKTRDWNLRHFNTSSKDFFLFAASKMLRRRIPQSGHLMTAKKFWLQTIPSNVSFQLIIFREAVNNGYTARTVTWSSPSPQTARRQRSPGSSRSCWEVFRAWSSPPGALSSPATGSRRPPASPSS